MGRGELPTGPPTAPPQSVPPPQSAPNAGLGGRDQSSTVAPPPPFVPTATPAGRPITVRVSDSTWIACLVGAVIAALVAVYFARIAIAQNYPASFFATFVGAAVAVVLVVRAVQQLMRNAHRR